MESPISLIVNGHVRVVTTDARRRLLDVLREDLGLTGTKFGCGEGRCGACTVLIDGAAERSCVVAVGNAAQRPIVTIEGLAVDGNLHPVQEAFLAEGALQCGYCTPGMILGAVSLLNQLPHPSDADIASRMQSHICRCGGYSRIVRAIRRASAGARRWAP